MSSEKQSGIVKWFDNRKGFGFIKPDAGGEDVFVHFGDILGEGYKTLLEGQRVQFVLLQRERGLAAAEVSAIQEDS